MKKRVIVSLIIGLIIGAVLVVLNVNKVALDKLDIIDSELIEKDSEYKLVFFGYAGCYHFCDPRLHQIDPIYNEIKKQLDIKVLFVDISLETTLDEAATFAKDVNSEFETINPDSESIEQLQKKFQDVYIRKMPDGEYLHSGFLYLLKKHDKKYYLIKIYPEFINTDAVIENIRKIAGK